MGSRLKGVHMETIHCCGNRITSTLFYNFDVSSKQIIYFVIKLLGMRFSINPLFCAVYHFSRVPIPI